MTTAEWGELDNHCGGLALTTAEYGGLDNHCGGVALTTTEWGGLDNHCGGFALTTAEWGGLDNHCGGLALTTAEWGGLDNRCGGVGKPPNGGGQGHEFEQGSIIPSSTMNVVPFSGVSALLLLHRLAARRQQLEGVEGASRQDHNTSWIQTKK